MQLELEAPLSKAVRCEFELEAFVFLLSGFIIAGKA